MPLMDPTAQQAAEQFASKACPSFTPSQHFNAVTRKDGATMHCVACHQPQYLHWLRSALVRVRETDTASSRP